MQRLQDSKHFPAHLRGGVLCVGNFDGVHLGHAQMLATGRAQAASRGRPFTIMTFDPHPSLLLKPHQPRFPLTTLDQRIELLSDFQPDALLVVPTTREFLAMPAEDFLRDVVAGSLGAALLVEGRTFTYGRGAKGNVETLQSDQGARAHGIDTLIVPTQETSLSDLTIVNVSSSVIRWLIGQGRVADAARALGRPYGLRGQVVEGARRGQTIGFPTANLRTPQLLPAPGVYAGAATVDGRTYGAAISVGDNPTFAKGGDGQTTVEAFLLDFSGDLYGRTLDITLHRWVREMLAFAGVGPLTAQMRRDVQWTRRVLAADQTIP